MSSIKGGHAKGARAVARSRGVSSLVCATELGHQNHNHYNSNSHQQQRRQVHKGLAAASYRASGRHYGGQLGQKLVECGEQRFGRRAAPAAVAHNVRLLSIISLIVVIAMVSRECTARAFLGLGGTNAAANQQEGVAGFSAIDNYGNAADKQQQQPISFVSAATGAGLGLDQALELGCRNLVESVLYPQLAQPRDQRAAMEFMEFMDNERIKRLSPKHTPRFGR